MKFYKRIVDEKEIKEITKKDYREMLSCYYKNTACFIDSYYNEENPIRTPFTWLWCEE